MGNIIAQMSILEEKEIFYSIKSALKERKKERKIYETQSE